MISKYIIHCAALAGIFRTIYEIIYSISLSPKMAITYINIFKINLFRLFFRYGGIRGSYQHFGGQGGQDSGFPSPRSALGYPFPPMHQNSYSGYHLGSYAPPCSSPPKDGKFD